MTRMEDLELKVTSSESFRWNPWPDIVNIDIDIEEY